MNSNQQSRHPADHVPKSWDSSLKVIMDMILAADGPKLGQAAEIGRRTVKYLRPKDMLSWLWKNWDEVEAKYPGDVEKDLLRLNKDLTTDKLEDFPEGFIAGNLRPGDMIPLVELLLRHRFIYRADRHEIKVAAGPKDRRERNSNDEDGEEDSSRPDDAKDNLDSDGEPRVVDSDVDADDADEDSVDEDVQKMMEKDRRWPKRVLPYPTHSDEGREFNMDSVYVVSYERQADKRFGYMVLIGLGIAAFVMVGYRAWPLWAKEVVAYLSVVLLSLLIFVSVLRLVTFLILWYAGYDFWILPNLWADDLGFFDTFRPLFTFHARNDGRAMYIIRAVAFVMMCLSFVKLNETHSLTDFGEFASVHYLEFVDWGVNKLTGQGEELAQTGNTFGAFDLSELLKEEDEEEEEVKDTSASGGSGSSEMSSGSGSSNNGLSLASGAEEMPDTDSEVKNEQRLDGGEL